MCATVFFRIKCYTEFKQNVCVVGNVKSLGCWKPQNGFQLTTNSQIYPLWYSDYALEVQPNQDLEFKIVITDGQHCYWEKVHNRHLKISYSKQIVTLTFDNPFLQIVGLKKLVSETDLHELDKGRARKVSIQLKDHLDRSYSDSDDETESDLQSLFQDDPLSQLQIPSTDSIKTLSEGCVKIDNSDLKISCLRIEQI